MCIRDRVTIAYGHQSYSISVKQFGLEPVIDIPGLTDDGMKAVDAKAVSYTHLEDGLLRNAKFDNPHQICFTEDGKLYMSQIPEIK